MHLTAHEALDLRRVIVPDAHGVGTVNGTGIDCRGYRELAVFLDVGTIDASGTVDFKLQDSADNSTFADISGAAATQITASNKQYVCRVNLENVRRYVRGVLVIGTAASDVGAFGALLHPIQLPVTQGDSDETDSV